MTKSRGIRRRRGTGSLSKHGVLVMRNGLQVHQHTIIVEAILGKPLPKKAVIHHVDGNPLNNEHSNLVVCDSQSYHMIIHTRQRAYDECGNANYRKCPLCKVYDDTDNMEACSNYSFRHKLCISIYNKERYKNKCLL